MSDEIFNLALFFSGIFFSGETSYWRQVTCVRRSGTFEFHGATLIDGGGKQKKNEQNSKPLENVWNPATSGRPLSNFHQNRIEKLATCQNEVQRFLSHFILSKCCYWLSSLASHKDICYNVISPLQGRELYRLLSNRLIRTFSATVLNYELQIFLLSKSHEDRREKDSPEKPL